MVGSLIFVHGTGVRLAGYQENVATAKQGLEEAGLNVDLVPCAWGDPLGVDFEGLSLPDLPDEAELMREAQDEARWTWLFDDPLFELNALTIRAAGTEMPASRPGRKPVWRETWEQIAAYRPSLELDLLLRGGGLREQWDPAWSDVVGGSDVAERAFEASAAANELADVVIAMARALIAWIHIRAVEDGRPGPSRELREKLRARLVVDWGFEAYGLGTFVSGLFMRAATSALRRRRNKFSGVSTLPVGDILLYQSRGGEIRDFIRAKIAQAPPPVALLAHSLGGIACFDLLAMNEPPEVSHLVTMGSQAPYFYEIGVLESLRRPDPLPAHFPPWLNIYDRDDFLSFVGERLFPGRVTDHEVSSGQPFPHSHGAYPASQEVWSKVGDFIGS